MNKRNKLLVLVFLALVVLSVLSPAMRAQDTNHAALVVRFDDDTVAMQCIAFSEPQITGYDLLTRSDQTIVAQFQGGRSAAVCAIGGTGCPADDCFCQCKSGEDCVYWSYFRQVAGSWQYSQQGAVEATVLDGSVDGWSWGPGSLTGAIAPPDVTFEDICGPTEPTNTPIVITPLATRTRRATAVPTIVPSSPTPSRTVQPADTAVPTAGPATGTRPPAATATDIATPLPPGGERVPDLPPTNTPESADAPLVTDVAPVQPVVTEPAPSPSASPELPTKASATASSSPIVIAAVTPAPREAATVIGADSVAPTAEVAAAPPPTTQASGPMTWVPYTIFLLIVVALGLLLVIAQRRRRNG